MSVSFPQICDVRVLNHELNFYHDVLISWLSFYVHFCKYDSLYSCSLTGTKETRATLVRQVMYGFLTCGIKQIEEEGPFISFLHPDNFLCNIFWCGTNTTHCQENVVLQKVASENLYTWQFWYKVKVHHNKQYEMVRSIYTYLDLLWESGTEHHSLSDAFGRHCILLHDASDLWFKTHIQHAVRLIQDQVTTEQQLMF